MILVDENIDDESRLIDINNDMRGNNAVLIPIYVSISDVATTPEMCGI